MPKLAELTYNVDAVQADGDVFALDDAADGIAIEDYADQEAVRVTIGLQNARVSGGKGRRAMHILQNGAEIRVAAGFGKPEHFFRGRIFRNHTVKDGGDHRHEAVAYDPLFYMLGSEDDRYYPEGKTAVEIIKDICREYQIPEAIDEEHGPTEKLSKKAFKGKTLAAMCKAVLGETRKKDGGRWLLRADNGKLVLFRVGSNEHTWYLTEDNAFGVDVDRSIEELVTEVAIVGRTKNGSRVLATARSELADDYGTLRRILDRAAYNNAAAAEKAAKRLIKDEGGEIKTRSVVGPDIPGVHRGYKLHVAVATMNGFYVVKDIVRDPLSKLATYTFREEDEVPDFDWKETGLEEWTPPDDRLGSGAAAGGESAEGFMWPTSGSVTSGFGTPRYSGGVLDHYHEGVDIGAATGTPVVASKAGTVSFAGYAGGYGNVIYITHEGGWSTRYAHLSSIGVTAGQRVEQGQRIGAVGNTGTSTGPHLHFEIRKGGTPVDPIKVLP